MVLTQLHVDVQISTVKPGWFLFHSVFEHLSDHFFGTFLRNSVVIELHLFLFVFFLVNSFFLIILFVLVISIADHLAAVEGLWLSIIVCDQVHRILKQLCRAHGLIHALLESSISNPNTQHKTNILDPVVQRVNNAIRRINHYLANDC